MSSMKLLDERDKEIVNIIEELESGTQSRPEPANQFPVENQTTNFNSVQLQQMQQDQSIPDFSNCNFDELKNIAENLKSNSEINSFIQSTDTYQQQQHQRTQNVEKRSSLTAATRNTEFAALQKRASDRHRSSSTGNAASTHVKNALYNVIKARASNKTKGLSSKKSVQP